MSLDFLVPWYVLFVSMEEKHSSIVVNCAGSWNQNLLNWSELQNQLLDDTDPQR